MRRTEIAPDRQQYLVPCDGHPNVSALVAPPTPRLIPGAPTYQARFAEADRAMGRLEGALPGLPNWDLLTRTLSRREAVQSSQIEGTKADLGQLLTYEATLGLDGLPADVQVTGRYVEALQYGLDAIRDRGGRKAITRDLLNELHAILMLDAPPEFPRGAYRTTQVWIGSGRIEDATFVPAPPARVPECMAEMEHGILQYAAREDEQSSLAILAQLAIAHAQFETIHPYQDGNGRAGRLLLPLILAAEGYPPLYLSGALLRYKSAYYDALSGVQLRGEWGPWVTLLSRAVVEACDDAIEIARDLSTIQNDWLGRLGNFRSDSAIRKLPRFLIGHPVVSVRQVSEGLEISIPAANTAINNLARLGILRMRDAGKKWGRVFYATEILERLSRPPAAKPTH